MGCIPLCPQANPQTYQALDDPLSDDHPKTDIHVDAGSPGKDERPPYCSSVDTRVDKPDGRSFWAVWPADTVIPNTARVHRALVSYQREDEPEAGDLVCLACPPRPESGPRVHHGSYCPLLRLVRGHSPGILRTPAPRIVAVPKDVTWFGSTETPDCAAATTVSIVVRCHPSRDEVSRLDAVRNGRTRWVRGGGTAPPVVSRQHLFVLMSLPVARVAFGDCDSVFIQSDLGQHDSPLELAHIPVKSWRHVHAGSRSETLSVEEVFRSLKFKQIDGGVVVSPHALPTKSIIDSPTAGTSYRQCMGFPITMIPAKDWSALFPDLDPLVRAVLPAIPSHKALGFSFQQTVDSHFSASHGHKLVWSSE